MEDRSVDMSSFFVEKSYGKVKPRLLSKFQLTSQKGLLITSCQDNDRSGYQDKDKASWRIFLRSQV